ncbi:hypothetical protein [Tsukamurella hominis]|uniref:hypothetical protein n=1 Tax=Tsukamurella hominis TaxID=1970232 RepID=UPI0039EC0434
MKLRMFLRGNRSVESGNFPLYRLCVSFGVLASILQLTVGGAPESVLATTGPAFVWLFIAMQSIGSVAILAALYVPRLDLDDSLRLEQVGALFLLAACATYFTAVTVNNGGPPTTFATWLVAALGTYLGFRAVEIRAILRIIPRGESADGSH